MFDPLLTLSSGLGVIFDIIGTTLNAVFLPFVSLILFPLASILQLFS